MMKHTLKNALRKALNHTKSLNVRALFSLGLGLISRKLSLIRVLEIIALLVGIPAALTFVVDLQDRRLARTHQAWQMLALQSTGSTGKADALEYLNLNQQEFWRWPKKIRSNLTGVDVSSSKEAPLELGPIDLSNGILAGSDFSYAQLDSAVFDNADLTHAKFNGASLVESSFLDWPTLRSTQYLNTDLYGSDFTYAFFKESCLIDVDFRSAELSLGSFNNSLLFHVDFTNSNLERRDFIQTNISGSNFAGATIDEEEMQIHWGFDSGIVSDSRKKEDISRFTHLNPKPIALTAAWYWDEFPPTGLSDQLLKGISSRPMNEDEKLAIERLLQNSNDMASIEILCNAKSNEIYVQASGLYSKAITSEIKWK